MTPEERAKLLGTICGGAVNVAKGLIQSFVNDINRKDAEIQARDAEIRRLRTMIADHEGSGVPFGEAYKRKPKKWIENRTTIQCPECGREFNDEVCCYESYGWPWLCCPKCGARMEAHEDA